MGSKYATSIDNGDFAAFEDEAAGFRKDDQRYWRVIHPLEQSSLPHGTV